MYFTILFTTALALPKTWYSSIKDTANDVIDAGGKAVKSAGRTISHAAGSIKDTIDDHPEIGRGIKHVASEGWEMAKDVGGEIGEHAKEAAIEAGKKKVEETFSGDKNEDDDSPSKPAKPSKPSKPVKNAV